MKATVHALPGIKTTSSHDGVYEATSLGIVSFSDGRCLILPPGFRCDGYTVPRPVWSFRAPIMSDATDFGGFMHDFTCRVYRILRISYLQRHAVFNAVMVAAGERWYRARVMQAAVIVGSWAVEGDGCGDRPGSKTESRLKNGKTLADWVRWSQGFEFCGAPVNAWDRESLEKMKSSPDRFLPFPCGAYRRGRRR